jgi:hypothetical protein
VNPLSYVKSHPGATIVTFAAGWFLGPWAFAKIRNLTGIGISAQRPDAG